jgi:hypothetical protein
MVKGINPKIDIEGNRAHLYRILAILTNQRTETGAEWRIREVGCV